MTRIYKPKTERKNVSHKPQALPEKFRAGFLSCMDGRSNLTKALRANYDQIVKDIGEDNVGSVKATLVEKFVFLSVVLQSIEAEMVAGQISKSEAISKWVQALNSLVGLAKVLGVERKSGNAWGQFDAQRVTSGGDSDAA